MKLQTFFELMYFDKSKRFVQKRLQTMKKYNIHKLFQPLYILNYFKYKDYIDNGNPMYDMIKIKYYSYYFVTIINNNINLREAIDDYWKTRFF